MFIIPVFVIFLAYILYQYKNKWAFDAISFIFFIYVVMGLSSIVLYSFFQYNEIFDVQFEPMIFLSLCLCIIFFGISSYTDKNIKYIIIENVKLLRLLEVFQIISSIMAFIYFAPLVSNVLTGDIHENRMHIREIAESFASFGIFNSIFSLVGNMFIISMILAFVNLATIKHGGSRVRAKLLLISSSIYIVYVLAYVGRDGFVYWVLSFYFFYLMFKDFVPEKEKIILKKLPLLIMFPGLVFFLTITFARFLNNEDGWNSVLLSIFEYMGSQIFYFSDHYTTNAPPAMGYMNFGQYIEIVSNFFGLTYEPFDRIEWYGYFTSVGVRPWTFSTFIGSFLHDFGKIGTLLSIILIFLCIKFLIKKVKKTKSISLSRFLILIIFFQVVLWGVFYYRQYTAAYYQLAVIIISFLFWLSRDNQKVLVIKKVAITH